MSDEARELLEKSKFYMERGYIEAAITSINQALELKPDFVEGWNYKGSCLYDNKNFEEALVCFNKALEFENKTPRFWNNKGRTLRDLNRLEEAMACFDTAIKIDSDFSDFADSWQNKGIVLKIQGKTNEAIKCIDKILQIEPADFHALTFKAAILFQTGDNKTALSCYQLLEYHYPYQTFLWWCIGLVYFKMEEYGDSFNSFFYASELDSSYKNKLNEVIEMIKETKKERKDELIDLFYYIQDARNYNKY